MTTNDPPEVIGLRAVVTMVRLELAHTKRDAARNLANYASVLCDQAEREEARRQIENETGVDPMAAIFSRIRKNQGEKP